MGVSKRICAENRKEIKILKAKTLRILNFNKTYPNMHIERRMNLTVKLNEMMERVEYLKRNKNNSEAYDFTYVYKKDRVKNRTL